MSLINHGFPDLYARAKEQEDERVRVEKGLLHLIANSDKITTTQEGEQFKLELITRSGLSFKMYDITFERFKKVYPESYKALRARGFIPLVEV